MYLLFLLQTMNIDINTGKFSYITFAKVALLTLLVINILALVATIPLKATYPELVRSSWIILFAFPIVYGLTHAAMSNRTTITATNFKNKDEILDRIDRWMTQRKEVGEVTNNRIDYHAKGKFGRFTNRIFDVFLTVEHSDSEIVINGNKNIIRYLLYEIKKCEKTE